MYFITPELSAASEPPYKPLSSSPGTPSIANSETSPLKELGAFPNTIKPPQRPLLSTVSEEPNFSPGSISSATVVITIGLSAVPCASIFPPLAIAK